MDEIALIWSLDRSEIIENVYYLEAGALALKPERYDIRGWPPGEPELYSPILVDCYDQGGWFCGLFVDARLSGWPSWRADSSVPTTINSSSSFCTSATAIAEEGWAQGCSCWRGMKPRAALRIDVSPTPTENTINFYLRRGCILAPEPDPELFALKPEDIHLECSLAQQPSITDHESRFTHHVRWYFCIRTSASSPRATGCGAGHRTHWHRAGYHPRAPNCDGAALGEASYRDFLIFTQTVTQLQAASC